MSLRNIINLFRKLIMVTKNIYSFFENKKKYAELDITIVNYDFLSEIFDVYCENKNKIKNQKKTSIDNHMNFFTKCFLTNLNINHCIVDIINNLKVISVEWGFIWIKIFWNDKLNFENKHENIILNWYYLLKDDFFDFSNLLINVYNFVFNNESINFNNYNHIFVLLNKYYPHINKNENKEFISNYFYWNEIQYNLNGIFDFILKMPSIFFLKDGINSWNLFENNLSDFIYSVENSYDFNNEIILSSHAKIVNNKNYVFYKLFDTDNKEFKKLILYDGKICDDFNYVYSKTKYIQYTKNNIISPELFNYENSKDKIPIAVWYYVNFNNEKNIEENKKIIMNKIKKISFILSELFTDIEIIFDKFVPVFFTKLKFNQIKLLQNDKFKGIYYADTIDNLINLPFKKKNKFEEKNKKIGLWTNKTNYFDCPYTISNEINYVSDLLDENCDIIGVLSYYKMQSKTKFFTIYDLIIDFITINYNIVIITLLNEYENYECIKSFNSINLGREDYNYENIDSKYGDRQIKLINIDDFDKIISYISTIVNTTNDINVNLLKTILLVNSNNNLISDIDLNILNYQIKQNSIDEIGYGNLSIDRYHEFYIKIPQDSMPVLKIAISWLSVISYDNYDSVSVNSINITDLDLFLFDENNNLVASSTSWDNNIEFIEYKCMSNKTYKIYIKNWSNKLINFSIAWYIKQLSKKDISQINNMDISIQSKIDNVLKNNITETFSDAQLEDPNFLGMLVKKLCEEDNGDDEEINISKINNCDKSSLEKNLEIMQDFDEIIESKTKKLKHNVIKELKNNNNNENVLAELKSINQNIQNLQSDLQQHKKSTKSAIHELDRRLGVLLSIITSK